MTAGFSIPGEELPPELVERINESVTRFEEKFTPYRLFVSGQLPGWIAEYRTELNEVALLALKTK
jgi:hypothetical protein